MFQESLYSKRQYKKVTQSLLLQWTEMYCRSSS